MSHCTFVYTVCTLYFNTLLCVFLFWLLIRWMCNVNVHRLVLWKVVSMLPFVFSTKVVRNFPLNHTKSKQAKCLWNCTIDEPKLFLFFFSSNGLSGIIFVVLSQMQFVYEFYIYRPLLPSHIDYQLFFLLLLWFRRLFFPPPLIAYNRLHNANYILFCTNSKCVFDGISQHGIDSMSTLAIA